MKLKSGFVGMLCSLCLTGCVGITSVSLDNIAAKSKGEKLVAESSGVGILTLTVPNANRLEAEALDRLRELGATKNVTSRLQMRNFMVVQLYSVVATGEK